MTQITYGLYFEANPEERTVYGLMLPYGEEGHGSDGAGNPVTSVASAGSVSIPEDLSSVLLNRDHTTHKVVGKLIAVDEKPEGLYGKFRIAKTTSGNDLLVEIAEGLRAGLSVEISNVVQKGTAIVSANLTGVGAVIKPAFASAKVHEIHAAESGLPIKESTMENTSELVTEATFEQAAPLLSTEAPSASFGAVALTALKNGGATELQFALDSFKTTNDGGKAYLKDQEVELWEAHKSERPLVNAVTNKGLTSLVLTGTRKTRTVAVADWAGNLVELPTGTFTTSREYFNAKAKAVAVELAMEVLEFGSEDIVNEIYAQAVDSYITQTETELITKIGAQSTAVSATMGAIKAIDYASQALVAMGASLSTIVVSADVYSSLLALKGVDAPWWLANQGSIDLAGSSASVGGINFKVAAGLAPKTVLVFDKRAIQFYESAEFRQRAVNVANGGVTVNLIKFNATYVSDPQAVLRFTNVTGA